MSEIRDFLVPMTVPELNSSNFASSFQTFCQNVKDNINKIVSAPFLKGDRGSKISFIDEPLKIDGQWTKFAKNLISSIYKTTGENPLPLMPDGELVSRDDEEWSEMELIDGGSVSLAEWGYNMSLFESVEDPAIGTGKIKVISKTGINTVIKITNCTDSDFIGSEYILNVTEDNFDSNEYYQLYNSSGELDIWINIQDKINLHGDDPNNPEMFYSFDIFRDLESIPVCYDEATGKKFLCVPFYFFDGRLDYVGYIDNYSLPRFRDMSYVIFGEASFIKESTKENLEDPDSWQWTMKATNILPKLYYNVDIEQFCWEVAGEQTNIIAQGVKGDTGDSAGIWVCEGEVVTGDNTKKIKINNLADPDLGFLVKDIKAGDLALVSYNDDSSMAAPGEEEPYYRIQFGIVHATGDDRYIKYVVGSEIIGKLRNYSLHDYLRSIGDDSVSDPISALYALERDTRNVAVALWAKTSQNHYLAPIRIGYTSSIGDAEQYPESGRTLNILYDTVKFKKKIIVDNIQSTNGLNTNATNVLNSISGNNLKSYRLGVLCNVLGVQKSDTQMLARIGEGGLGLVSVMDDFNPIGFDIKKSTADYLFIECELVMGWIPEDIAMIFNDNLSSNTNNPALEIYRAQKYHIYLRVPVIGAVAGTSAGMSLDGKSWKTEINLTDSLSYRGNNKTFVIKLDPGMRFEEKVKRITKLSVTNWFAQFEGNQPKLNHRIPYFDNRLTCYKVNTGYEFFYEYLTPNMDLRKDKVRYSEVNGSEGTEFAIYLNQFQLSGGSFSISSGLGTAMYKIDNLIWFGERNIESEPESKKYPLIDNKFSFLNYFKKNNSFITTTNNSNNWMWQGRVLSADAVGGSSLGKQDLYYINTSFYETLCPSDFNAFVVKNPDITPYDSTQRHISRVPINSAIHIYPEGMCGLGYDRVVVTNNSWGQTPILPSSEISGYYVPAYQNVQEYPVLG